jgi:hypothetical protein
MPVQFRTPSINIPSGTGRRSITAKEQFVGSQVLRAGVALNGFKLDYDIANGDHHLNLMEADTDVVSLSGGDTVNYRVEFQLADKNFDDPYSGYITVLVIAEVA